MLWFYEVSGWTVMQVSAIAQPRQQGLLRNRIPRRLAWAGAVWSGRAIFKPRILGFLIKDGPKVIFCLANGLWATKLIWFYGVGVCVHRYVWIKPPCGNFCGRVVRKRLVSFQIKIIINFQGVRIQIQKFKIQIPNQNPDNLPIKSRDTNSKFPRTNFYKFL